MENFDRYVIQNIKDYIADNNLSVSKIAVEAGISYHRLWCILTKSYSIKLSDYIAICKACMEPLDKFLPKSSVYFPEKSV